MTRAAEQLSLLADDATPRAARRWGAVKSAARSKARSPVPRPWQAVIVGVDTARIAGWSVFDRGTYVRSGELDSLDREAIEAVIASALQLARDGGVPCVLVLEKPWGGSVAIVSALGAARERWLAPWRALAVGHVGKVVLVQPNTWRAAVLGKGSCGVARDIIRAREQLTARALLGAELGSDESPAVLIGYWATHAGELACVLGKRERKRQMGTAC